MVVYGIFRENKCVYVGQTRNKFANRISKYKSDVKYRRNIETMPIIRAMIKHGFSTFSFQILAEAQDLQYLDLLEIAYIYEFRPRYNASSGGVYKKALSVETRKKIGELNKRRRPHQFRVMPVICIETDEWFCSTSEAARHLNIGRRSITNAINGKSKTAGGYHFKKSNN